MANKILLQDNNTRGVLTKIQFQHTVHTVC